MQENSLNFMIKDAQEEIRSLHHPRSPKNWKVMQQECYDRIVRRKRLTLTQGIWLYNRYMSSFKDSNATREPHDRMMDELSEARTTILRLRLRIEELEGAHS